MFRTVWAKVFGTFLAAFCASPVWAHASEQMFVLLLPTDVFITAGCLTVLGSMILMSLLRARATARLFQPMDLAPAPNVRRLGQGVWGIAAMALIAMIVIGVLGPRDPLANLLPLFVWTVWWVGLVVLAALIGPLLVLSGPWQRQGPAPWSMDDAWPALVLFCAFGMFGNVDVAPEDPDRLANLVLGYLVFTALGITLLDVSFWIRRVEFVTVLFRLIASLAPVQMSDRMRVGMPGWAALQAGPPPLSIAVFCVLFLGIGSFDGLKETFWWLAKLGINPLEFPGRSALVWPNTWGMIGFNAGLLAVFFAAIALGHRIAGRPATSVMETACWFSLSFLPIAIGYHASHFMVSFLINIQYVPIVLNDPFAQGADLFGLGTRTVTSGFLNTLATVQTLWLSQAGIVVVSHILAVLMAHWAACRICSSHRQVLLIQLPLACLMIAYTLFGLWLLASPRGA